MGHSTTKTTEEHYGRIRNDHALDDIEKARGEPDRFEAGSERADDGVRVKRAPSLRS
jgi:hypothetical protein